ncbi:RdRP-domain-containing protein [Fusarium austroafricanum]|uniref:RNA-dependent RNA polymerase n=1 Tax=Fusarium austroafricanum TaxID=2364996 RepID=A0A8H4KMY4_9HYPO|nr:RdRP-domain-containing protein [Fusarium austroafricanum]
MAERLTLRRKPNSNYNDIPGGGQSRPGGIELRLLQVPKHLSTHDLQSALSKKKLRTEGSFMVILDKSSEEIFWESFSPKLKDIGMTARVIVPNQADGSNPAAKLIGKAITLPCSDSHGNNTVTLRVEKIRNPETSNQKFEELRNTSLVIEEPLGLRNGLVADIRKVSCGTFNGAKFDVAHTWQYTQETTFRTLSYFGDAQPSKYRVCLPDEQLSSYEWMDFHETNIQSMIFERPDAHSAHCVMYFVLNKPPQFYGMADDGNSSTSPYRMARPSCLQSYADYDLDICGVPWVIQYCRVFKVEYDGYQNFSPDSVRPMLQTENREEWSCFEDYGIKETNCIASQMAATLRSNIDQVSRIFPENMNGCRLAVLKLFYNCNISATSPRAPEFLNAILGNGLPRDSRHFGETLNRASERAKTSHGRAVEIHHQFHNIDPMHVTGLYGHERSDNHFPVFPDMDNLTYDLVQQEGRSSPGVFDILVYPSHVEILGPVDPPSNSVMDRYQDKVERFLRVRFVDNNAKPLKVEPGVDLSAILDQRVLRALMYQDQLCPVLPALGGFEFLGYSMSGLKKRKAVWFFQGDYSLDANTIRGQIGDWDVSRNPKLANYPSKWGARISLAFTQSHKVLSLYREEWEIREDYGHHPKFPNTDGCGLISRKLCEEINDSLVPIGLPSSRAFQIRFGGVKGVVFTGEDSLLQHEQQPVKMLLRNSQLKLRVPDPSYLDLRVVSTAGDGHQTLFLPSALRAFEDSGANTTEIERIYSEAYESLTVGSSNAVDLLQQIYTVPYALKDSGMKGRHYLLKLAIRLKEHGIHPHHYPNTFLADYLIRLAAKAREKDLFKIPIPGSFSLLGLTDDYRFLRKEEVFIRAHGKVVHGPVLIYRDPVIHLGDIQQAKALDMDQMQRRLKKSSPTRGYDPASALHALLEMDNVIFFSQKDDPPFPNRLSGGDLDGDRFEILTKGCRFWGHEYKTTEPDSYTEDQPKTDKNKPTVENYEEVKSFDISQLAHFITQYIRNDCFSQLEQRLLALADQKPDGMNNADVKDLAPWLSQAVDYAKSGKAVDLVGDVFSSPKFKISQNPDFLRAFGRKGIFNSSTGYYQSSSVLGKIYRRFENINFNFVTKLDNRSIIAALAAAWPQENKEYMLSLRDGENHHLTQFVRRLDSHAEAFGIEFVKATTLRSEYNEFLSGQTSEVDLLLGKLQSNFTTKQVQDLMQMISDFLVELQIAERSATGSYRIRPRRNWGSREDLERMYKQHLYAAWKRSIENWGNPTALWGFSHAYLCLYALYCEELPIDA